MLVHSQSCLSFNVFMKGLTYRQQLLLLYYLVYWYFIATGFSVSSFITILTSSPLSILSGLCGLTLFDRLPAETSLWSSACLHLGHVGLRPLEKNCSLFFLNFLCVFQLLSPPFIASGWCWHLSNCRNWWGCFRHLTLWPSADLSPLWHQNQPAVGFKSTLSQQLSLCAWILCSLYVWMSIAQCPFIELKDLNVSVCCLHIWL